MITLTSSGDLRDDYEKPVIDLQKHLAYTIEGINESWTQ